jgi:hypothetical protein
MTKEGNFFELKVTFAELGIKLILPQLLQNHSQVLLMFSGGSGVYKDVINEHHYELVQFVHEYLIHHVHEINRGISDSEGHHCEHILPISGDESCLRNVIGSNFHLMISGPKIDLGKELSIFQLI